MPPVDDPDQSSDAMPARYPVIGATAVEVAGEAAEKMPELRRARRQQVLKRAQLGFGFLGSTIDCLIIDESPFGVLSETPVMTQVPEHVKLRLASGATFDALRRWTAGNKIGFEFIGSQIHDEATLRQRMVIDGVLRKQGLHAAAFLLRDAKFFNNVELEIAAEAAMVALSRLQSLLL